MNYKIYQSKLIIDNHQSFINNCKKAYLSINKKFGEINLTWDHYRYNFFSVTSSSILFYELFKELNFYIREYIKDDRPLWIQSWLNYHPKDSAEQVLAEHGHLYPYHGYISIDPQNTTTIFNNGLEIKNKPGQIYIGPGRNWDENNEDWDHKVVINEKSSNPRITIAFDISDKIDKEHEELSFFPLY